MVVYVSAPWRPVQPCVGWVISKELDEKQKKQAAAQEKPDGGESADSRDADQRVGGGSL